MLKENNKTFNFNEEKVAVELLNEIITTATTGVYKVDNWYTSDKMRIDTFAEVLKIHIVNNCKEETD